jgi:hypothetical protein
MGSYKNSLAAIHEASQESHDVVGRLPVKTRGWLVEEEKGRLGHQLNAQGHPLPLLNS